MPKMDLKAFSLSRKDLKKIIRDFHSEMERGLAGKKSSLKMIPTYVDKPTGNEKGKFIALDLGGTNFRVLEIRLKGRGRISRPKVEKFVIDKRHMSGSGQALFDLLAESITNFIKKEGIGFKDELKLGFTFSFPVHQTSVNSGRLVSWTKGFNASGVKGRDVVSLLDDALGRKGVRNVKVSVLVNDTVGTLAALGYERPRCDVGVIIGTGTNACYRERVSRILKWKGSPVSSGHMIINIEWGNFNKLRRSVYDIRLDRSSKNRGEQALEKMVSGMYLGELVRLKALDALDWKIFNRPFSFKAEHMSIVEADRTKDLSRIRQLLRNLGKKISTIEERKTLKKICEAVSVRAARISAAAIVSVATKMDPILSSNHIAAIDGSVFEKHPTFAKNMETTFKDLLGKKTRRIEVALAKDGSGKGAAILAAVA